MKKSLIALAAVAAVGAASAQSSVTLYGVLDTAVNGLNGTNIGSQTRMTGNGGNQASRLGFRGVEDLGGGLKASFVLEAGLEVDRGTGTNSTANAQTVGQSAVTGSGSNGGIGTNGSFTGNASSSATGQQGLTFNRRSTVSLEGSFGEVRAGRDLTPSFMNIAVYDPFGAVGVGSAINVAIGTLNPIGVAVAPPGTPKALIRASNSITYFTPGGLGGFSGSVMYSFSENSSSCTAFGTIAAGNSNAVTCQGAAGDGKYFGLRGGYDNGPISGSIAYGKNTFGSVNVGNPGLTGAQFRGSGTILNLGGSYNFGVAKAMAQYGTYKQGASDNQTGVSAATALATGLPQAAGLQQEQKLTHYLLGVSVPVGAGEFKASYNWGTLNSRALAAGFDNSQNQRQYAFGYVQNLSKRTALYTTYSRMTASGIGATASMGNTTTAITSGGVSVTGYDIGVRHSF